MQEKEHRDQTVGKRKNLAVDLLDKEVRKKYLHT